MARPHARQKNPDDPFDNTVLVGSYGDVDVGQVRNLPAFHMHPGLAGMLRENYGGQHMFTFRRRGEDGGHDDDLVCRDGQIPDDARTIELFGFADGFVLIREEIDPPAHHVEQILEPDQTLADVLGSNLYRWSDLSQLAPLVGQLFAAPGNWVVTDVDDDLEDWLQELLEMGENDEIQSDPLADVDYQQGDDAPTVAALVADGAKSHLESGPIELCRWETTRGEKCRLTVELTQDGDPALYLQARYDDETPWIMCGTIGDPIEAFVGATDE